MTNLENEFPLDPQMAYLNHAAVAPWPRRASEAVARFAQENITNGARYYPHWLAVENQLRRNLQRLMGAGDPGDLALVKNTSGKLLGHPSQQYIVAIFNVSVHVTVVGVLLAR